VDLFKILLEDMSIVRLQVLEEGNNLFLETLPVSKHSLLQEQIIHNKSVFHSFNEALNLLRPYGKFGLPPIWSTRIRCAYTLPEDPSFIYLNAKEIVMEYASMEAGILPNKSFMRK